MAIIGLLFCVMGTTLILATFIKMKPKNQMEEKQFEYFQKNKRNKWSFRILGTILFVGSVELLYHAPVHSPSVVQQTPKIENQLPATDMLETQKEQKPQISIPDNQRDFISAVTSVVAEYNAAPNELKKSLVRSKRAKLISNVLHNSKDISNWVGNITTNKTNIDGKAYIEIELEGSNIKVKTWNNTLSDYGDNTMISQDNKLFYVLAELSDGDTLIFSGSFLPPGNDLDYIRETSFTESGSMSSPEFVAKISKLKKY